MIHVFIGTKAQLIKMAPVMVELQNRGIDYNFIFSGQHQATIDNIREDFGLKAPDVILYHGKDVTSIAQMLTWSLKIIVFSLRNRQQVWRGDKNGIVLNHGDTFSTLLGSMLAKICGQRSAHVESGLRSFNLLHPFPEELTRVLTFRLSNIYFAPGQWALDNLESYSGSKVNTVHNTLLDSLRLSGNAVRIADVEVPKKKFAVVSLHRFENIFSRRQLKALVEMLCDISQRIELLFILHKPTEQKLQQYDLMTLLEECPGIELRPRYSYFQFIKLIEGSSLVITDGGSNQEECFYLGKPCIIMRKATERKEGLGENATLSHFNLDLINQIIQQLPDDSIPSIDTSVSPSQIIVEALIAEDELRPPVIDRVGRQHQGS